MADPIATALAEWLTANSSWIIGGLGTISVAGLTWTLRQFNRFVTWITPHSEKLIGGGQQLLTNLNIMLPVMQAQIDRFEAKQAESDKTLVVILDATKKNGELIGEIHNWTKAEEFPSMKRMTS